MSKETNQKYNSSDKGKARKKAYLDRTGRYTSSKKYQSKPFIAIGSQSITDGENIVYAHLALSTGQSITNLNGLTTQEILGFITSNTPKTKDAILVTYGSTYDFNQFLNSINLEQLETIWNSNHRSKAETIGTFKVRVSKGQSFYIKDLWAETRTISDIYGFFQQPLKQTLEQYTGKTARAGNAYTQAVTTNQLQNAAKQLMQELQATAELMEEFRKRLDKVNLRPLRWSGAGSITTNLFQKHNIKSFMAEQEQDIQTAARYAYAGGRFENVLYGQSKSKTYAYDINSAYPEALTKLPALAGGRWHHIGGDPGDTDFGLYKVSFEVAARNNWPVPLFARDVTGSIFYPNKLNGWYWSPEIAILREWAEMTNAKYEIDQAYIFEAATNHKPFEWIQDLYNKRLQLQAAGDEAEIGLKLALNSAYGKLAQQVGWLPEDENGEEKTPSYHQLEYAGYVTSYTRAKLFRASLENPTAVIAYETDCLYSSEELTGIIIGDGLGEYKETIYNHLTYLGSGIYFGEKENGEKVFKLRGIQTGTATYEMLENVLQQPESKRIIKIPQQRFISASLALQAKDRSKWLKWVNEESEIKLYPHNKRSHFLCWCTDGDIHPLTPGWHETVAAKKFVKAVQYSVEWINPETEQLQARLKARLAKESLI